MDIKTLQTWLDGDRPVTVLDIRPQEERAEWFIPGSVHVDAYHALKDQDPEALANVELPKDRPVVTVCAAGKTSRRAAEQLNEQGYEAVSLRGGMKAWSFAYNTAALTLPNGVKVVQVRRTGKGCLSYLVSSAGEALIIDPALDPNVYRAIAAEQNVRVVGVVETHVHADHLSRAHQLAEALNVPRYLPAQTRVRCPFTPLSEGDEVAFGNAKLTVLHTPGHTWESSAYGVEGALFTGDTLFVNSVGRPDLEAEPEEARRRAAALYTSLQRLLALPETTLVLPGHASEPPDFSGTLWAAPLATVKDQTDLLGLERDAFIKRLTQNLPDAPANHQRIVALNESCALPTDPTELEAGANRCAVG